MYFYDTETCGLHGMPVLLQYSQGQDEIVLHELWHTPIGESLDLIEKMMDEGTIGFNLTFDHFQLCKFYTVMRLMPDMDALPVSYINEIAMLEPEGRDGPCLKPRSCLDLMLHARKGPYQSTMDRKPIRIRRVPKELSQALCDELESRVELRDIYFARRKDKRAARWKIMESKDYNTGQIDTNFNDIVLQFRASGSLKAISEDVFNLDSTVKFKDIEVDPKFRPEEVGFAPYALATEPNAAKTGFNRTWPARIKKHIDHWRYNKRAREYAEKDVIYTRGLYYEWGEPKCDDDDSILACMVAACRWRGYAVDVDALKALRNAKEASAKAAPKSANRVKEWIFPDLDEQALAACKGSTKKVVLESIAKFRADDDETKFHPAAIKAQAVLAARSAKKELEILDKLILAGRFHASFDPFGALSGRMSGRGGDLNSQGIKRTEEVRVCFPLAQPGRILCGGDFESYEVTIADAVWKDPKLHQDLQLGKSIHGIFGTFVYPELTYDDIMKSKKTAMDYYSRCKQAVFAMLYGGEAFTLKSRLGVDLETAEIAHNKFLDTYTCVRRQGEILKASYCTLNQPNGMGGKIYYRDPKDYVETILGDKRFFTLENKICKILFELAEKPPAAWNSVQKTCVRTKERIEEKSDGTKSVTPQRVQKVGGATRSALYGTCFGLQNLTKRAAGNHLIQSVGARIMKKVQCAVWELQPYGICDWLVQPMQVHDELMCPALPEVAPAVKEKVDSTVEKFREVIPLIGMDWQTGLKTWADK